MRIKRATSNDPRLLLLGPSDCGKSTFLKQFKIIYNVGFSEKEVIAYKDAMRRSVMDGLLLIYESMEKTPELIEVSCNC